MANSISGAGGPPLGGVGGADQTEPSSAGALRFAQKDIGSPTTELLRGQISQMRATPAFADVPRTEFSSVSTPSAVTRTLLDRLTA